MTCTAAVAKTVSPQVKASRNPALQLPFGCHRTLCKRHILQSLQRCYELHTVLHYMIKILQSLQLPHYYLMLFLQIRKVMYSAVIDLTSWLTLGHLEESTESVAISYHVLWAPFLDTWWLLCMTSLNVECDNRHQAQIQFAHSLQWRMSW